MLTFAGLKQHVLLAIGGQPSIVSGVSRDQRIAEVINQAGQYLFSRSWRFRERTSRPVSVVAGQSWAALPGDAEQIVSLTVNAGLGWKVELTTPEQIELFRAASTPALLDHVYYAALSRTWDYTAGDAFPTARLDLYPTPQTTSADSIIIRYRAGWQELSTSTPDSYQIAVPPYVESLLIAYCRAFAVSYEDEGLSARLLEIDGGPLWNAAASKDGIQQRDYGRLPASRANLVNDPMRYRNGFVLPPSP